mgnify:CR=1 FL=1
MARFLKHIGCERCGSSDARAVYDDGSSFCFSCRKPTGSKVSGYVSKVLEKETMEVSRQTPILPSDANTNYSKGAVDWVSKYGIPVEQMLQTGMVFSPFREQLIFPFYGDSKNLLAYQARNLNAVSKAKRYYTCGDVNELLPIYHCRHPLPDGVNSRRLVLVEDCLSAIKVSYVEGLGADSMPLLGSGISRTKLSRLRPFYDLLDVFLDPDMWHKSLSIVKQAQLLGFRARPIQSDRDPKEHAYKELDSLLRM